jgi:hypothetical protein
LAGKALSSVFGERCDEGERSVTAATEYLAKRQTKYPVSSDRPGGLDRAWSLYQDLTAGLPPTLCTYASDGAVAVGELGRNAPDVRMVPTGDGAVIEFTSGMIDFIDAVVRTLAGNMVKVTSSGPENAASLSLSEVALHTAALFREWKWPNQWIWAIRRIAAPKFSMGKNVQRTVHDIATHALRFLLAHELGHVALERGLLPQPNENVELAADTIGFGFLLRAGERHGMDPTITFAAAVLAVRICAGLEHVGVRFSGDYPKQQKRVENLHSVMRSACPGVQYFHEIARIAVAYQDQMDDVDRALDKRLQAAPLDAERVLVRLVAELLDVALGRLSPGRFEADVVALSERAPRGVIPEALQTLHRYYVDSPTEDTFIDADTKATMGRALVEITAALPSSVTEPLSS